MELFLARVAYSNLDDKKVTESYLVDALSYTEAEAKVLNFFSDMTSDAVEIKTLKPLGVTDAVGLDVDGESYHYYIVGLTDGKGKTTARRVLIKELTAMDACNTISDSWENVVTSVRLLDVVNVIR
jgi:hypothetical protein|nr:MAG TPA: protein of unknown function (DUF4494) [Caudoviricetes sp.]